MANRGRRKGSETANSAAEAIGTALGHVAARVDAWKRQRAEIQRELQKLLASGQTMLRDLGENAGTVKPRGKGGRPKGYKMSEETRRKLRLAWKRRKAAMRGGQSTE